MSTSVLTQAALILVREGLEALLVVSALAAYLQHTGENAQRRHLFRGVGLAIAASLVTAWVAQQFLNGAHNDAAEGFVILVAAAVMFYVSGWLFIRQDPAIWQAHLRRHVGDAVRQSSSIALTTVAFVAVYREGAETVLFLHALAMANDGWSVSLLLGLVIGFVVLALAYQVVRRLAVRLPLRPLFVGTSALLFVMGLNFVGAGLQEFQELDWIGHDNLPGIGFLGQIGINTTLQALLAQIAICVAAVVTAVLIRYRRRIPSEAC